ncbi:Probable GTP-binding protein EngB [Durusdinium trenchii]|uniref:Probable GTP-binding protein EngB n=1 Tax=Durusdinium trenchii TaxID=1381693 RepID=A0ABP0L030_9DINO
MSMCVQIRECPQDAPYLAAPAAILESVDTIAQPDIGRAHRLYGYVNAIQDRMAEAVEGVHARADLRVWAADAQESLDFEVLPILKGQRYVKDAPYLAACAAILESVDTIAQPDIGRAHRLYGYVNAIQDRMAEAVEGVHARADLRVWAADAQESLDFEVLPILKGQRYVKAEPGSPPPAMRGNLEACKYCSGLWHVRSTMRNAEQRPAQRTFSDQLFRARIAAHPVIVLPTIHRLPEMGIPQVCVLGRSNVGKSSLINALVHGKEIARPSELPGRTRHLFAFDIGREISLVDLPGYGPAHKVSDELRQGWEDLVKAYLKRSQGLRRAICLVAPCWDGIPHKACAGKTNACGRP